MDKYICIVKVSDTTGTEKFLKYHVTDLINFTVYLDKNYKWYYFNVYDKKNRDQIANYTINNKPNTRRVPTT